jgi:hypothetical protein
MEYTILLYVKNLRLWLDCSRRGHWNLKFFLEWVENSNSIQIQILEFYSNLAIEVICVCSDFPVLFPF